MNTRLFNMADANAVVAEPKGSTPLVSKPAKTLEKFHTT
jgi:hypothetical protein